MSVIWSGVTAEGTVVPVQVTVEGKVVAVGDGPEGDYLKLTGGNLTGDLTLGTDKIKLDATLGNARFNNTVTVGNSGAAIAQGLSGVINYPKSSFSGAVVGTNYTAGGRVWLGQNSAANATSEILENGNASFGGQVTSGDASGNPGTSGVGVGPDGFVSVSQSSRYNANCFSILDSNAAAHTFTVKGDGSAMMAGDVIIGSRGKKWLIRESNGVAMLIEQTLLKQPREEKVRDLPNELDLIEAALNEIMEKLRMTPPDGWPVWDGSDNA